jgi:hypothetical protein
MKSTLGLPYLMPMSGCAALTDRAYLTNREEKPMSSPLPQQTSESDSGGGIKVGIKRFQSVVQVSLHCHGEYQAIELYDRLVEAAERGEVQIDLRAGQVAQDSG